MTGIVRLPVVTTLATALPESEPMMALAMAAVLAVPPRVRPVMRDESPIRSSPPPAASSTAPKSTNRYTKSAETPSGTPQIPSVDR